MGLAAVLSLRKMANQDGFLFIRIAKKPLVNRGGKILDCCGIQQHFVQLRKESNRIQNEIYCSAVKAVVVDEAHCILT